ncbi:CPBP family intramembrane metalloprotease [Halobacteriales archaeon SW_7_68_16]|nr:MAG: CPBP family intramembrane metalloprotease [Halobacteriales archaeon SW_7_68_16]
MDRDDGRRWLAVAALAGTVLTVVWTGWNYAVPPGGIDDRVLRDGLVFVVGPLALGTTHGRRLGWRVDRKAVRNTVALAAFVLPFYLVGSSLPTIRAHYPLWPTTTAPLGFAIHSVKLFALALAAETYYRGLLCVGLREIGPASVFVSPVIYALHHVGKPPVELLLSGPADVLFGAVDYTSESILPSVVAHGCGLVLLDWLVLNPPLFAPSEVASWFSWLPVPV